MPYYDVISDQPVTIAMWPSAPRSYFGVVNTSQTQHVITGIWVLFYAERAVFSANVRAVVFDSIGTLISRGPNTLISIDTFPSYKWEFLPLTTPAALYTGMDMRVGFEVLSITGLDGFGLAISNGADKTNSMPDGSGTVTFRRMRYEKPNGDGGTFVLTSTYGVLLGFRKTVNSAPNAPTIISPANFTSVNATPVISWVFGDPDAGDIQGAWNVIIHNLNTSTNAANSGWQTGAANSWTVPISLPEGDYQCYVTVRDQAGLESPSSIHHFVVDSTPPTIGSITPRTYTKNPVQRMSISGVYDNSGIFFVHAYILSKHGGADWLGPYGAVDVGGGTYYYDFDADYEGEGQHLIRFWVYDPVLNGPSYNGSFMDSYIVYDITPPLMGAPSPQQYTTGTTATVSISGVFDATSGVNFVQVYQIRPDGTFYDIGNATDLGGGNFSINVTGINIDGNWGFDFRAYDLAGNVAGPIRAYVFRDTTKPTIPTQVNGTLYATSNGVSWSAFSDGAISSGRATTTLYLEQFVDSSWMPAPGYPLALGDVLSYNLTDLTPGTDYLWSVVYVDKAGNENTTSYTPFTTNIQPTAIVTTLTSDGYIINPRPVISFTVWDANNTFIDDFQIEISYNEGFNSLKYNTRASLRPDLFSSPIGINGSTIRFTPDLDFDAGDYFVRVRAFDGIEWGPYSEIAGFNVLPVNWTVDVEDTDTAISKRTIDSLRTAVNAVRQARGLAVIEWSDSVINDWNSESRTSIRAAHLTELRQGIADIYVATGNEEPQWTDPIITPSVTQRKGKHWAELITFLESV
jgi:hypothetical protein